MNLKSEVEECLANAEHNGYPHDVEKEDLLTLAMEMVEYGGLPEETDLESIVEALEEIRLDTRKARVDQYLPMGENGSSLVD